MAQKPYKNWERPVFDAALYNEAKHLEADEETMQAILMIIKMGLSDSMWDAQMDFDGCTLVFDHTHPDLACWGHDLLYKAKYFKLANQWFKAVMKMQGVKPCRKRIRMTGVRISVPYFRLVNKRVSDYSEAEYRAVIDKIK